MAYVPEINDKNGLSGDIHPRFRHGPFFHDIVKKKGSFKTAHCELGGFFDDVWAGVKTGLTGGAQETANAVAASVSKAAIASLQKKNAAKARAVQPPPAEAPIQESENPAPSYPASGFGTPVDYTRYIPYALAGVGGLVLVILIARRRS
jgi:hypothetical protein